MPDGIFVLFWKAEFGPGIPRWFLPSRETVSTIEYRSEAWPFIPVWRLGMSRSVHPRPRQGAIGCEKTAVRQVRRARRPPVQPRIDEIGRHVGARLALGVDRIGDRLDIVLGDLGLARPLRMAPIAAYGYDWLFA